MARVKYYWPTMRLDIERHIVQCLAWAETKGTTQTAPILEYPLPAGLFNVVGIDLLQQLRYIQGSTYVFVCVDHFSHFTVLSPLISLLLQWVMPLFHLSSAPTRLLVFSSVTMGQNLRIRSFRISALYFTSNRHPASNGLVERTNRKIFKILRYLAGHLQETREDWLFHVAASINGSVNQSFRRQNASLHLVWV